MASGSSIEDGDIITDINVTPLVDIMLVLLIIFMLTANIINNPSIEVNLPEASTGEGTESTILSLTLSADGTLYLNGAPTDEAALRAYLPELAKSDPKVQAIIAADKEVSHGEVIKLIDLIRQLGIFRFTLNVDPTRAPVEAVEP